MTRMENRHPPGRNTETSLSLKERDTGVFREPHALAPRNSETLDVSGGVSVFRPNSASEPSYAELGRRLYREGRAPHGPLSCGCLACADLRAAWGMAPLLPTILAGRRGR